MAEKGHDGLVVVREKQALVVVQNIDIYYYQYYHIKAQKVYVS
ncbi:hypothetical protein [Sulfobacillus sp. hq2]|nr:hypothetical protein [Sulfobacillus sp. hq2]